MGHAGMAAAAVRYLRSVGAPTSAPVDTTPRPELRAVREGERAPLDPGEFRRVLGNFASGVTVITAPDAPDDDRGPAGFACQSFVSLSLDPPLVAFMVSRSSTSWPRIARTGVFCVNILGASQAELCRAFAVSGGDKFAGVEWTAAPGTGAPLLAGVPAWVDCTIHAVHTGGDHLIVIGQVAALGTRDEHVGTRHARPGTQSDPADETAPLLFHLGRFGTMAR